MLSCKRLTREPILSRSSTTPLLRILKVERRCSERRTNESTRVQTRGRKPSSFLTGIRKVLSDKANSSSTTREEERVLEETRVEDLLLNGVLKSDLTEIA